MMRTLWLLSLAAASAAFAPPAEDSWTSIYTVPVVNAATSAALEKHFVYPTTPHCEDISVQDTSSTFWKANFWKYEGGWRSGLCPSQFNFVNKKEQLAAGITHRLMGIDKPVMVDAQKPEVEPLGVCSEFVKCPFGQSGADEYCAHYRDANCPDQSIAYCKYNGNCKFRVPPPPTTIAELTARPVVKHGSISKDHCTEIYIPSDNYATFMASVGNWKYPGFTDGKCDSHYNIVDSSKPDSDDALVTVVKHGIKAPALAVPFVSGVQCGAGATGSTLSVTNHWSSKVKLRTCSKAVDPNTGWACNHGTAFVDCFVFKGDSMEVDFAANVESVLPEYYNSAGNLVVSDCYWKKPASGWPSAVTLDQAWFDSIEKSC